MEDDCFRSAEGYLVQDVDVDDRFPLPACCLGQAAGSDARCHLVEGLVQEQDAAGGRYYRYVARCLVLPNGAAAGHSHCAAGGLAVGR